MSLPLSFRRYGDSGPVIVLIHGLFGSSSNWGAIARELQDRYQVLVPDLRNHGQSPHHAEVSHQAMADDVLALLDAQSVERAILVGHSMGGKVAMQLTLSQPHRVDGLAVVDIAPVTYSHNFDSVFAGFAAVDLDSVKNRIEADKVMARQVPDAGVRAFLLLNLQRDGARWQWRLNLHDLQAGYSKIAGFDVHRDRRYSGPTAFIHGDKSDYLLPLHYGRVRQLFPRAQICTVRDAGHWVYSEQPEEFGRCLRRFLRTVG